jgi:hypothetical protein
VASPPTGVEPLPAHDPGHTDNEATLAAFLAARGMPTAVPSISHEHVEAFIVAELESTAPASAATRQSRRTGCWSSVPSGTRNPVVADGHGLPGEDVTQLVCHIVWEPVEYCLNVAPLGRSGISRQLTL